MLNITELFSFENLYKNFRNCRTGKRFKPTTGRFEFALEKELLTLHKELLSKTYHPSKVNRFIIREPKPREIIAAQFRDRVVHHLICSYLIPIFEKRFIFDSYANRKQKGTHKALQRLLQSIKKITKNYSQPAYYLKIDVKSYFATIHHEILYKIIKEKIKNSNLLWLIDLTIQNKAVGFENYQPCLWDITYKKSILNQPPNVGLPIGNITSQLFANIYLDKLDHFAKQTLKTKFYIRYVDDVIILHSSPKKLKSFLRRINGFLEKKLKQQLHPNKTHILPIHYGIDFLGYYVKYQHIYVRRSNVNRFKYRLRKLEQELNQGKIKPEQVKDSINAWYAYVCHADSYNLRKHLYHEHMKPFHSLLKPQKDYKYFGLY